MTVPDDIGVDLPPDWADTIAATAGRCRRLLLVGPTDVGKSSFARALIAGWPDGAPPPALLDADPGQKMVGPPGAVTLSVAGTPTLKALRFVGTTSAAAVRPIVEAVAALAHQSAEHPLIINSSGLIRGPGAALLLGTVRSAAVDEIVAIGWPPELASLLDRVGVPVRRLRRPASARRKGQGERARSRREAFRAHLADGRLHSWPRSAVRAPSPDACLLLPEARPICALAHDDSRDLALGVLVGVDDREIQVFAPPSTGVPGSLRLGAMWARPRAASWELLDQLLPASDRAEGGQVAASSF